MWNEVAIDQGCSQFTTLFFYQCTALDSCATACTYCCSRRQYKRSSKIAEPVVAVLW
jgi:hypothetical protein